MASGKSIIQRLDEPSIPWSVVVRIALGAYFIYAGIAKAAEPFVFMKAIRLYHMLPDQPAVYLNTIAVVLPWLEIICGIALVLGVFRRGAGLIIALMLCAFTPAVFLRSLEVMNEQSISFFAVKFDCGCGGGPEIIWFKLLKNVAYFLGATITVLSRTHAYSLPAVLSRMRTSPESDEATQPESSIPTPVPVSSASQAAPDIAGS